MVKVLWTKKESAMNHGAAFEMCAQTLLNALLFVCLSCEISRNPLSMGSLNSAVVITKPLFKNTIFDQIVKILLGEVHMDGLPFK